MSKRKILMLAVSACMIAILAIGGTLAYFTDKTGIVENVFTVGGVEITLFESAVTDKNGEEDAVNEDGVRSYIDNDGADETVTGNTYENLLPGASICKDPTVTNTGSVDAYIRVSIKYNNQDEIYNAFVKHANQYAIEDVIVGIADTQELAAHQDSAWVLSNGTAGADETNINEYELEANEKILVYWFTEPLKPNEQITLFTSIEVPAEFDEVDMEALENLNIEIWADAIQADGFNNVLEAFEAFDDE